MIHDEGMIYEFFEQQTELSETEGFILFTGARKKYDPKMSRSDEVIFRELIRTNDTFYFLRKVRTMDFGMSQVFDSAGRKIDEMKAGVIYFKPNPSDILIAYLAFKNKMDKYLYQAIKDKKILKEFSSAKTHFMSEIHKTRSRKIFGLIDIDKKDEILLKFILSIFNNEDVAWITETRGGYHIVYYLKANEYLMNPLENKLFMKGLNQYGKDDVEFKHSNFVTPVWGTYQGGFKVKEYKF